MDRRLSNASVRAGLFAASIALAVFALAFVFAIYYIA
jgi:hypothetical protein